MGSRGFDANEEPIHRVVIEEVFWMAETPVTQEQFDLCPGAATRGEEHWPKDSPKHPANNLSWTDAVEYCEWFTTLFQKQFPKGYAFATLPCEVHWEYACRGGMETEYYSGDGESALKGVGWYDANSGNTSHAVGTAKGPKASNGFGLYDMHGNVWEWCQDRWYGSAYQRRWDRITDREMFQLAEEYGNRAFRVFRGGSWIDSAWNCRAACRDWGRPDDRDWSLGFRVCLFSGPVPSQTAETGAASEPGSVDGARRQAAAKSQEPGVDAAEVDLGMAAFPERSDGTKF